MHKLKGEQYFDMLRSQIACIDTVNTVVTVGSRLDGPVFKFDILKFIKYLNMFAFCVD
jgi:hypothetical protein